MTNPDTESTKMLLDTSVLIRRTLAPKEISSQIENNLSRFLLYSNYYIKGEFNRVIIRDIEFLISLFEKKNVGSVFSHLGELPRTRRVSNFFQILGYILRITEDWNDVRIALQWLKFRVNHQAFYKVQLLNEGPSCTHAFLSKLPKEKNRTVFHCDLLKCRIISYIEQQIEGHPKLNTYFSEFFEETKNQKIIHLCKTYADWIIGITLPQQLILGHCNPKDFIEICQVLNQHQKNVCKLK